MLRSKSKNVKKFEPYHYKTQSLFYQASIFCYAIRLISCPKLASIGFGCNDVEEEVFLEQSDRPVSSEVAVENQTRKR